MARRPEPSKTASSGLIFQTGPLPGHELTEIAPGVWSNGHLRFDPIMRQTGRSAWIIRFADAPTDAAPVGRIRWNPLWREYVLFTCADYVFAHDCLTDISELLRRLNEA